MKKYCFLLLFFCDGQLDYQLDVIGLDLRLVGGAVAVYLTAFGAFMNDDIALFGVGLGADGLHKTAAFACPVSRIYIKVLRPQAIWAMIAGGVAERLYLLAAVLADEGIVVFRKKLGFHIT